MPVVNKRHRRRSAGWWPTAAWVVPALRGAVRPGRPAVDRAGAAAGPVAPDPVYDPQRAAAVGAARLQLALPLVRWPEHGRAGVGPDRVHQEPPAAAGRRGRHRVPGTCGGAGAAAEVALGRTSECARSAFARRPGAGRVGHVAGFDKQPLH